MSAAPDTAAPAATNPWLHRLMLALAMLFIGGEGMVQIFGANLPFSTSIPEWARGLLIVLLTAGGAYFRQKLTTLLAAEKPDA